jgi:hypothetical protein
VLIDAITLADYEQAEAELRARDRRAGFVVNATLYVLVNILLLLINLMLSPGLLWFVVPLCVWGAGLAIHYLYAVRFIEQDTRTWQARVERRAARTRAKLAA